MFDIYDEFLDHINNPFFIRFLFLCWLILLLGGLDQLTGGKDLPQLNMSCAQLEQLETPPKWVYAHDCVLDYATYGWDTDSAAPDPDKSKIGVLVYGSQDDALNPRMHSRIVLEAESKDEREKIISAAAKYPSREISLPSDLTLELSDTRPVFYKLYSSNRLGESYNIYRRSSESKRHAGRIEAAFMIAFGLLGVLAHIRRIRS